MSSNIQLYSSIEIDSFKSKLEYGNPKNLDNGGKIINIYYNGSPLYIQTPVMNSPFGMTKWNIDGGDKCSIDLSLGNYQSDKKMKHFHSLMEIIDKKLIEDGLTNSTAWFKKKISSEAIVEALYTPLIKYPKDKNTGEITDKYPPTFRVSIPFKDNEYKCKFFKDREEINIDNYETKRSKMSVIMQCVGIWIAGGKFGCTWKAVQVKVTPPATIDKYAFNEDDNDNIDNDDLIESDNEDYYSKCKFNEDDNNEDEDEREDEREDDNAEEDREDEKENTHEMNDDPDVEPENELEDNENKTKKKVVRRKKNN